MITVAQVSLDTDLESLVAEINAATWDEANDIVLYHAAALRGYLERQDTVFVACHETDTSTLLGMASARLEMKPYGHERWLYVDEVDVCADQRRKGAGRAMMQALLDIARRAGCTEVWLGTEIDNDAANALYAALAPSEREQFVGYAWDLEP